MGAKVYWLYIILCIMKNSFLEGLKNFTKRNYVEALNQFFQAETDARTLLAISYCYYRLNNISKCVEYLKKSIEFEPSEKAGILKLKLQNQYKINLDRWERYVKCVACSGRGERFTGSYDIDGYPQEVEKGCFTCHGVGKVDPSYIKALFGNDN